MTSDATKRTENNQDPVDRAYLARFTAGNIDLEREILQLFAEQLPLYVEQLRAAQSPNDWKLAAHTIKGSALAIGARRLANEAHAAELLDWTSQLAGREHLRLNAVDAVDAAAGEARRYIACLFATA